MKTCSTCKQQLLFSAFTKQKNGKFGLRGSCKDCRSKKYKLYMENQSSKELKRNTTRKRMQNLDQIEKRKQVRRQLKSKYIAMKGRSKNKFDTITDIGFSVYINLIKNCYYCNIDLLSKVDTGINLDRIDNKKGYTLDNVIPCCFHCNASRADNYSVEEFKNKKMYEKSS